jgi:hypothetical protein
MRFVLSFMAAILVVSLAGSAPAAPTPPAQDEPAAEDEPPEASVAATAATILPGIALHGFGHYVAGEKKTAFKIFQLQLVGLAMVIASGVTLQYSGGSRYGNELAIPVLVGGSGLFVNTFLADLYGSASGGTRRHYQERPRQRAALGYGYVYDPTFDYGQFLVSSANVAWGRLHVDPSLWVALDADNQRARLPIRYRSPLKHRGEHVEVTTAGTYHRFGDDGFATYVAEVSAGARIDLRRIGESLSGAFTSMSLGYGVHQVRYDLDRAGADTTGLLLGHYGFGFYLPGSGEIEAYYQHRRDDFTSGSSPSSRNGSGFLGHYGVRLRQPLNDRFALRVESELGAAWLISSSIEIGVP